MCFHYLHHHYFFFFLINSELHVNRDTTHRGILRFARIDVIGLLYLLVVVRKTARNILIIAIHNGLFILNLFVFCVLIINKTSFLLTLSNLFFRVFY